MRNLLILLSTVIVVVATACTKEDSEKFVLVKGGAFVNTKSNLYGKNATISDFYISKYEVTQKEWAEIMHSNPSRFRGDDLPVEMVSWYDCVEYCNKRSIKEGLSPRYIINKNKKDVNNKSEFDSIKWIVTINEEANGYRLPTEAEWEYAAGGGQKSKSYTYSGSNKIEDVAWYWKNSGDTPLTGTWSWTALGNNHNQTKPKGTKAPNELGIYDMSGNVREWCEDWYKDTEIDFGHVRVQRGGGWIGADYRCEIANRHSFEANGKGPDQGFRLCRSVFPLKRSDGPLNRKSSQRSSAFSFHSKPSDRKRTHLPVSTLFSKRQTGD